MRPAEPAGLLPVDKPSGPTSHDVVAAVRRALGTRRVGHTGTLDPFASGLLLLLVGRATRLAEYLHDLPKRYEAVMRLGMATDTDDPTGRVIARQEPGPVPRQAVRDALEGQAGRRLQRPPAFSAKKVAGTRAYEAAREGRPLELEPVPVQIDEIRVTALDLPDVSFEVTCGAGTYIRAIARDAGDALGLPTHLVELRRTAIGPFEAARAVTLDELVEDGDPRRFVLPPAAALAHLQQIHVDDAGAARLAHGMRVRAPAGTAGGLAAVLSGERLVAVAEVRDGELVPRKVLAHE